MVSCWSINITALPTRAKVNIVVVCWLLNVPATCWCISGTDLHRELYVLPLLHSQHIHTHMVFSMKEAASGATLPIPSTLSITTNSDSLVEFFIHLCKFLKYSISFSFNKIKFLLSPKIHHYSLTITPDSPALEEHAKAPPRRLVREVRRTVPGVRIY